MLLNVKMELTKLMLDGEYIKRIEFVDHHKDTYGAMNVEFKLN